MTRARDTSQVIYGVVVAETNATRDVEATDSLTTFTNVGSSLDTTFSLPVAVVGLEYKFVRAVTKWIRLDPDGTEIIGAGTAGQYLEMQSDGSVVNIRCYRTGYWSLISATGTIAYA